MKISYNFIKIIKMNIKSLEITSFEEGKITVGDDVYKDVIIFPWAVTSWNWKRCGTRHYPGITAKAVQYLIDQDCKIIILGIGVEEMLQVTEEALSLMKQHNIDVRCENSNIAWKTFNSLSQNHMVGALIHSTC